MLKPYLHYHILRMFRKSRMRLRFKQAINKLKMQKELNELPRGLPGIPKTFPGGSLFREYEEDFYALTR